MDADFTTLISPARLSRERALSWQWSERRSKKRLNKSQDRYDPPPHLLESLLKHEQDKSSIASDFPSLHGGFKNPEGSLHSLNLNNRDARGELLNLLADPYLNKGILSERHSLCSEVSFGCSKREQKRIFQIPGEPFRILDTPGIDDNYYSNVLDWSATNLIAVSLSNTVYLFNYETTDSDGLYEAAEDEGITSLAFSPEGDFLAVGNNKGELAIWDTAIFRQVRTIQLHTDRITCLDWTEKGLLSGSKDTRVLVSDTRGRGKASLEFQGHTQEIVGLKWDHEYRRLASGGNDNVAMVWDLAGAAHEPLMRIKHKAAVRAIGWSHKMPGLLATGGGYSDATIRTYDTGRLSLIDERETDGQVCSLLFSRLTNDLITSHGNPTNDLSVWRTNGLKRVAQLMGHEVRPIHICLSPDSSVLISASPDETLRFWKLFEPELVKKPALKLGSAKGGDTEEMERQTSINREEVEWEPEDDMDWGQEAGGSEYDERSDLDFPMDGPESVEQIE